MCVRKQMCALMSISGFVRSTPPALRRNEKAPHRAGEGPSV